jgi:hypothetical protein
VRVSDADNLHGHVVAALSAALTTAGIEHSFEVYNERQGLVRSFPG